MKVLIILCALAAYAYGGAVHYYGHPGVYAHPLGYYAPVQGSQYRSQDFLGQYNYGYATANGIQKSESRGVDGSVAGQYSYVGADGKAVAISYTAGKDGFKASGDAIPKPVDDTPEVKEAKAKHEAYKADAAVKAAAVPFAAYPYAHYPYAHPYNYGGYHPAAYANYGYSYAH